LDHGPNEDDLEDLEDLEDDLEGQVDLLGDDGGGEKPFLYCC
jgi:hypothetical protein